MRPELGPLSPSTTRLWSFALAKPVAVSASHNPQDDSASPPRPRFPRPASRARRRASCRWRLRPPPPSPPPPRPCRRQAHRPSPRSACLFPHVVLGRARALEALVSGGRNLIGSAQVFGE